MKTANQIDHLRIASRCPTTWDQMSGNDRVRFCDLCNLHVYNIARLTRKETQSLIAGTEGRICARLYRRVDGTIITKDCPVGLRAIRRRVAKIAGAVFAVITSLSGSILGQKQSPNGKSSCAQQITVTKTTLARSDMGSISGTVLDPNGAVIPGVKIKVTRKADNTFVALETDDKGCFQIHGLKADTYELSLNAPGFAPLKIVEIKLVDHDLVSVSAILMPKNVAELIGVVSYESPLDTPPGTTIFSGDYFRRLPIPE